eukprot:TRINITY_DN26329_c0_g1_i1.p1 TRINITY_DN26329_c0_g1~~TRINITY_DN26329_c0_g1_i1.p1  ORF type:complete len:974 (+),score=148.58 TRINITY_DN26329_c0_g1_i1:55-2922(+)
MAAKAGLSWKLIARQDVHRSLFSPDAKTTFLQNQNDPDAEVFMAVGLLDPCDSRLRSTSGKYRFKLLYNRLRDASRTVLEWQQSSWITEPMIKGFEALHPADIGPSCNPPGIKFTGLGRSDCAHTIFDGTRSSHAFWWNSVGTLQQHREGAQAGIPGWNRQICSTMDLYVAIWTSTTSAGLLAETRDSSAFRLPSIFADGMVLQCDRTIPVWGKASPGCVVSVCLQKCDAHSTTADAEGHWRLDLPPAPASLEPTELHLAADLDGEQLTIKDVLIGEVWLCSGQSNMEWPVRASMHAEETIRAERDPFLRHFKVEHDCSASPKEDCRGNWEVASPATIGDWTAVGAAMAKHLRGALRVPVGLVNSSWSGTRIEPWCAPEALAACDRFAPLVADRADFECSPGALHDAMIKPLVPYALRGVSWYQGESNDSDPETYRVLQSLLIQSWRMEWKQPDLPFGIVQLASFRAPSALPAEGGWALIREAQELGAREAGGAGVICTLDLGDPDDIHPRHKQTVGQRLAMWALASTYGKKNLVSSGPIFCRWEVAGRNSWRLHFGNAEGLCARNGDELGGFAIAGLDGIFHWAEALIDGETVTVSHRDVLSPAAVRYAWQSNPVDANLMNGAGLPAASFRSDMNTIKSSEWVLIMRQTLKTPLPYWTRDEFVRSEHSPDADNFARLDQLESFRSPGDEKFLLKLVWPESGMADQIWKQRSNPFVKRVRGEVDGYEPINCPHTAHEWGGLQYDGRSTLLSGSVHSDAWFYAVGSYHEWLGGIPGPESKVSKVELYVKEERSESWILMVRQTSSLKAEYWDTDQFSCNKSNFSAQNFARLDDLEDFRHNGDGKITLKLVWPGSGIAEQVWKQSSNPFIKRSRGVDGYEPLHCPHVKHGRGGLQYDDGRSLLSGSSRDADLWFYALGSYVDWQGGIPGPSFAVGQVELYARIPDYSEREHDGYALA